MSATLEIPAGQDERSGQQLYVLLPIEPESGELRPFPDSLILDPDAKARHAAVLKRLSPHPVVPSWPILVESSTRAQGRCPDLWAVAWDWVVTSEGPRLLEGNIGWEGSTPQLLHGGFLRDGPRGDGEAPSTQGPW